MEIDSSTRLRPIRRRLGRQNLHGLAQRQQFEALPDTGWLCDLGAACFVGKRAVSLWLDRNPPLVPCYESRRQLPSFGDPETIHKRSWRKYGLRLP